MQRVYLFEVHKKKSPLKMVVVSSSEDLYILSTAVAP